jgi:hypothetical protein
MTIAKLNHIDAPFSKMSVVTVRLEQRIKRSYLPNGLSCVSPETSQPAGPRAARGGDDQVSTVTLPASAGQALEMVRAGMDYLAAADATQMPVAVQARCLQTFEQVDAVEIAARARVLGAFTASQGYCEDAAYSPRTWLVHQTRVTRGVAAGHMGWARRAARNEEVIARLAAGELSESFARVCCGWSDQLPEDLRAWGQETLLNAARDGADLRDLNALGQEMAEKARAGAPDEDELAFGDRSVRLETTLGGAGVVRGDLTPACAAALGSVLESLSAPAGPEDTRSQRQRYHDARAPRGALLYRPQSGHGLEEVSVGLMAYLDP